MEADAVLSTTPLQGSAGPPGEGGGLGFRFLAQTPAAALARCRLEQAASPCQASIWKCRWERQSSSEAVRSEMLHEKALAVAGTS